jgi:hypothetical protein
VLKPGARIVVNELYTHTGLQRIRDSKLISRFLYSRMVNFIYGTRDPYVTEDERSWMKANSRRWKPCCNRAIASSISCCLVAPFGGPTASRLDVSTAFCSTGPTG